jgi:hypothetical protein
MASLVGANEFTTSLFQFGDVVLFRNYSKNAPTLKFGSFNPLIRKVPVLFLRHEKALMQGLFV